MLGAAEPVAQGSGGFPTRLGPSEGSLGSSPAPRKLPDRCVFLFQIYVHLKDGGGPDGLDALKNKPQLHGAVARSLCRNAAGKNYIIFTGPSITSLTLFEELEKQGWLCGAPVPAGPLPPREVVGRPGGTGARS